MKQHLSQKELVNLITENLTKLENGELDFQEIEQHLFWVKELYERTIVLRYKAFEKFSSVEISNSVESVVIERAENNPVELVQNTGQETIVEQNVNQLEDVIELKNEIEDKSEKIEERNELFSNIEFDLFSNNEPSLEFGVEIIDDEKIENEPPIVEENSKFEESETEIITNNIQTTHVVSEFGNVALKNLIQKVELHIKNQLGYSSLPSLVGSFGLNERLMFINELFDGSSEAFSEAIKSLDTKNNLEEAMPILEKIVQDQNWEMDSETVEEFIQKVCRRYA